MEKKKIIFILNPISGAKSKASVPRLIDTYVDKERFDYEIVETLRGGHASDIARKASEENVDVVVAIGGDGTVNEVARAIAGTKTALGIIPYGSGNGLARHLMLPLNVRGALQVINSCEIHDLDYGVINGMPFFCTCGMGFDAFISMKFAMADKRGPITYIENVLREGLGYKPERYVVEDENGTRTYEAFLLSIANASQYGNDAYIAPQASMADGMMDVIVMDRFGVLDAANVGYDMMNKTLNNNTCIQTFKTKHVHIRRECPGVVHFDGEPIMTDADIDVSIREKGIRIVVNPNADKRRRRPTKVQMAVSAFMNSISEVRSDITHNIEEAASEVASDINKQHRRVLALNKKLQRKLSN